MKNISIRKYGYIDALRGYAIIGVVLVHSSQWVSPSSNIISKIASEGARGIQLFYIVSALTLFLSMSSRRQEDRPILSYFIRRFFRIAPLFYTAILIYTAYYGMSPRHWAPNGLEWWHISLTVFFLHGWHPETITSVVPGGWTIAVEMTFYLFLPYLFKRLYSIKSTVIALCISIVLSRILSIAIKQYFSSYYPESQQYIVGAFSFYWFFSQLPIFIIGILLFHIVNKYHNDDNNISILLLFIALFLFVAFLDVSSYSNLMPKHLFYGFAFLIFSLALHYSRNKIFVNGVIILIGKLSFSIYLVHFMVLIIMRYVFQNGFILIGDLGFILAFITVMILSTGVSYVTYKMIEIPGINIGKSIIKKMPLARKTG